MSTTMRPQPTHQSNGRHHPYAAGPSVPRKWSRNSPEPPRTNAAPQGRAPPSPPRSHRDSGSPPVGLGAAFGGKEGGKWWDEELPAPPASLSSILDSFRRSGEGDRDLLLAILGAKKAEEERLTSLIQTRLTILSARLSVHAATASLDSAASAAAAAATSSSSHPMPTPPHMPPMTMSALPERTPSLTSRGSASSSNGPVSPILSASYAMPFDREYTARKHDPRDPRDIREGAFHLPPPTGLWRRHASPDEPAPIRVEAPHRTYLPSVSLRKGADRERGERERERSRGPREPRDPRDTRDTRTDRSLSPRSEATGIDMLLDAGRRVSESRTE